MPTETAKRRTRVKRHPNIYLSRTGRYEVCWRDETGKLRFRTIAGNLEDAKNALADLRSRKARGETVAPHKILLDDYAEK